MESIRAKEEAVPLFGIYHKFVVYAAFFVVEHFRAGRFLPYRRVNVREECVCVLHDGVNMRDIEFVHAVEQLSVYGGPSDDKAPL